MEDYEVPVKDCSRIIFRIQVIGYKAQGESIVFELIDESSNDILYLGCIDSYELSRVNKTLEYLVSLNPKKLDLLCWSHPDNDHSKGLVDIFTNKKICDKYTKCCIPGTLDLKLNRNLDLSEKHRRIFDLFANHNNDNPHTLFPICAGKGTHIEDMEIIDDLGHRVSFEVIAITPNGGDSFNFRDESTDHVKNILSVGLLIKIGQYRFIFGSDMPNESIETIHKRHLKDPLWIKLPHHGSSGSLLLAHRITYESRNLYASTTVFTNHHLPDQEVLDLYMRKGCNRIDSTHTGPEIFGRIEYYFDLFNSQSVVIKHFGNARVIRQGIKKYK